MNGLLRTTITLPTDLLKLAKITSAKKGKTLSELVREGLLRTISEDRDLPPSREELLAVMGTVKSDSPMFKNPASYIRKLRELSDEG